MVWVRNVLYRNGCILLQCIPDKMKTVTAEELSTLLTALEKPWLLMLIGPPGCGKSTLTEHLSLVMGSGKFIVASTDNLIEAHARKVGKTYSDVFTSQIKPATKQMKQDVFEAFVNRKSVVYDQTNMAVKARAEKLQVFNSEYEKLALVFSVPVDVIKARLDERAKRTGKVIPHYILHSMLNSYVEPTQAEGFDHVFEVKQ
jgi:shikimate kinase